MTALIEGVSLRVINMFNLLRHSVYKYQKQKVHKVRYEIY